MSKKIGIVGAGTAGLHLGLYLRQHGVDVTIYTDRKPADYRGMRLLNTVAHHAVTLDRETALGVNHWPGAKFGYHGHYYFIGTQPEPLQFYGDLHAPSRAIDYRIYQPRLMDDFLDRGGKIEYRDIRADEVSAISAKFDATVVCTGKGPFGQMFAPRAQPFAVRWSAARAVRRPVQGHSRTRHPRGDHELLARRRRDGRNPDLDLQRPGHRPGDREHPRR